MERITYSEEYIKQQTKNLSKFSSEDLIDLLLESREQRDNYKELSFEFKKSCDEYKFNYESLRRDIKKCLL